MTHMLAEGSKRAQRVSIYWVSVRITTVCTHDLFGFTYSIDCVY